MDSIRPLIVDDSSVMRKIVERALRQGGLDLGEVLEAGNGADALIAVRKGGLDLILSDINMPVMDGITLIQNLRKIPAMKSKPILMLTTEGLAAKKEQGKAAGATGWIVKPFNADQLIAVVQKLVK